MTDATAAGAAGASNEPPATIPYYEKSKQHLKELLQKKRLLEKQLAAREDAIYQRETEYLDNTPQGNIITGFDNYTKGITGAAAQRRKTGLTETNRVFSRSSVSYNPNHPEAQTPGSINSNPASHAPTPSASSVKDMASNQPTPTSATAPKLGTSKSKKKTSASAAASAAAGPEESETDGKEPKKVRTHFGAVKKS
ncbi:hypothetical protein MCOR02_005839 [Pyricularia oryzae]|uniref:Chromatin modification-related protein EAF6 n=5 Tax=Pyricularia TaxID=48558 RepID=A0ABQ8NEC4_PYRGI|nr:uncharacterized protein MGG_00544 [Pyricularia oryzae 70-15]ELQ38891.1 hypothetical protein OOU_Y34scaffold00522g46 [Pyricularia oryzae Y34]KAH8840876.1 hypothetical protein MCOR01_007558 [Pyricularia oryzae]KAI6295552.1 hypothetical protein MCOR33_007570 [Pyricularia grisea]EHA48923.1 hypothetical protein MGG_00544 [Pyricularia oryzae 70-15]KAH9433801.1 hypothetical protein MCOR02_005839 [Pyricularia oryzae]